MRIVKTALLIFVLLVGGFVLYHRNQINNPSEFFSLLAQKLKLIDVGTILQPEEVAEDDSFSDRIKIASFTLSSSADQRNGVNKVEILADICLDFDVIAFQQTNPDLQLLADLVTSINDKGKKYNYIQDSRGNGYAIFFDTRSIELDSNHHYSVNDPEHLFERPPLVGWFRSKQAPDLNAFTFTIANFQTSPQNAVSELAHLDALFSAIREDGRGEDDVLIVGDFHADDHRLRPLEGHSGLIYSISNQTTTVNQTGQLDNILFHKSATIEFGSSGVVDFMRLYNLRLAEALQISQHNPIWAEFSIYEGQKPPSRPPSANPFGRRNRYQSPSIPTFAPSRQPSEPKIKPGRVAERNDSVTIKK